MIALVNQIKYRVRLLQLLVAADVAALSPISLDKLHSFAYLADILSPVWNLRPFEDRIGRTGRPPYFPDLQRELDLMVAMGLVEPVEVGYIQDKDALSFRLTASYSLRENSESLIEILQACETDEDLCQEQTYLSALAGALASLPDEDIAAAATRDLVYERSMSDTEDYVELAAANSRTSKAVESFDRVFPGIKLTPSRRLVMYAQYLGRRANG